MQVQPTRPVPRQRPSRSRRPPLAALPDPREQRALVEQAAYRAHEALAAAAAAGRPILDRTGRQRSPVTLPEYRRGRAPRNKGRRFAVEVLTAAEVQAILAAVPRRGATATRNRALIVVLWRAGLRIAEVLALLPKDVDLALGAVTVLEGKGAKRRVAALDRSACRYVEAWLTERDRLGVRPTAPLFCVTRGKSVGDAMHSSGVRDMLKAYARRAGVQKRVHPHGFRHTHAFELSQEDVPVRLIQEQLGHSDLAMTSRYIDHLSPKQLLERVGSRAWPGERAPAPPFTGSAMSGGEPVPASSPAAEARLDPPEPAAAPPGRGTQRVLDAIAANGGSATQGQLRRALGVSSPTLLKHLHRLHERGQLVRAGFDRNRSIIWKLAPPPLVVRPVHTYRQAPRGEGPRRVLDAVEALGGRASQAQLARALGLAPTTVHDHCLTLEAEQLLQRGGLDKSTSRRGSQVWRIPPARTHYLLGGYSLRLKVPR